MEEAIQELDYLKEKLDQVGFGNSEECFRLLEELKRIKASYNITSSQVVQNIFKLEEDFVKDYSNSDSPNEAIRSWDRSITVFYSSIAILRTQTQKKIDNMGPKYIPAPPPPPEPTFREKWIQNFTSSRGIMWTIITVAFAAIIATFFGAQAIGYNSGLKENENYKESELAKMERSITDYQGQLKTQKTEYESTIKALKSESEQNEIHRNKTIDSLRIVISDLKLKLDQKK